MTPEVRVTGIHANTPFQFEGTFDQCYNWAQKIGNPMLEALPSWFEGAQRTETQIQRLLASGKDARIFRAKEMSSDLDKQRGTLFFSSLSAVRLSPSPL